MRIRGVRITREEFLRQELRKLHMSDDSIASAVDSNPVLAGVCLTDLDKLADGIISFETNKSAAMSFAAGLPGGFAMLGTIPADLTQYYVHAFRIMQKLAYLYGWRELLSDMDEVDDETIGVLAVFFGVMLGVGGAAQSLTAFARSVAVPAFQKQVTKQALTKTSWYPVMKHCLRYIGINLTKKGFAQGVSKAIPLIGGAVSGGMTFVSLQSQSHRLKNHLRKLPAPGVDAEVWKQAVSDATPDDQEPGDQGRHEWRKDRGYRHRRWCNDRGLRNRGRRQGHLRSPQVTTSPTRPGLGPRASAVHSPGLVTVYTPPLFAFLTRPGEGKPATICG